jgi:hypothetical protein
MRNGHWNARDLATLTALYPDLPASEVARRLGRGLGSIYNAANKLGLHKSAKFFASESSGRMQRARTDPRMTRTQFQRGHETWNKGKKGWRPGGRSAETQFKKGTRLGVALHNYVPIGSDRICASGYVERKVTDDPNVYPARRWIGVHRIVWEAERGAVPAGHIVVFRPGMRTTVVSEITADRLETISRAENMRRNTYHKYPKEIARAIQLRGALNRKINKLTRAP